MTHDDGLGSRPCIVVSTAEVAREVFQNHDAAFLNRPPALANEIITGYENIVFSPHGPHWRHLRRICNTELFSSKSMAMLQRARTEEIHNMMRVLRDQSLKGDATNLKKWLYSVMCNNVTRMVFNKRYNISIDRLIHSALSDFLPPSSCHSLSVKTAAFILSHSLGDK
jgi:cytochrome P450